MFRFTIRDVLWLAVVVALAVLVPCAYIAGYLALMEPRIGIGVGEDGTVWRQRHLTYRRGGGVAEFLFAPVAAIDVRLRSDYWCSSREPGKPGVTKAVLPNRP